MAATTIDAGTAMILASAATMGATTRPSGETQLQQCERIAAGIGLQLAESAPGWAVRWLLMTPTNANLAYIAENETANQAAVVIRGTDADITDVMEDFAVSTVVPFPASGAASTVSVSSGAMAAFTEIVSTPSSPVDDFDGGMLEQALTTVLAGMQPNPSVFVIGHSLGGCVATMVAPYLYTQCKNNQWQNSPSFGMVTFAAPTAGLQSFATYFQSLIGSAFTQCDAYVNVYDLVPQAWASLNNVLDDPYNPNNTNPQKPLPWYPKGTTVTGVLKDFILALEQVPGNNVYVQPVPPNPQTQLNTTYELWNDRLTSDTFADFLGQIGYQHANSTYLALVDPSLHLLAPPTVTAVTPAWNQPSTTSIEVVGSGFAGFDPATNLFVDFGTSPCPGSAITVADDAHLVINDIPALSGVVDIRVTTPLGTSAATPSSQFAFGGPEPVWVSSISPTTAPIKQTVTIYGQGFAKGADVFFGRLASPNVEFSNGATADPSGPYLTAEVPGEVLPKRLDGKTVNVTVAVNGYSSSTSPTDEFTYPPSS